MVFQNGFHTQFRILLLFHDGFFKMSSSLSPCSLLHAGCGGNGGFEKSEDWNLSLVWFFSRGISGVSTSTMVFKIQALTRRIGLTSAIKQWVFLYGVLDMSTHLEIFQQESHFTTSEFAVIPPSVLDILLPAPFWGRQQVVVHSSEESGLT